MRDPWLSGLRVLVVEDEAVISLLITEDLRDFGYEVAGPFSRGSDALAWVRRNAVDLAILDYELKDGNCLPLARELSTRGIPFMLFSATFGTDRPAELKAVPWVMKPAGTEALLDALDRLTETPGPEIHLAARALPL